MKPEHTVTLEGMYNDKPIKIIGETSTEPHFKLSQMPMCTHVYGVQNGIRIAAAFFEAFHTPEELEKKVKWFNKNIDKCLIV